MPALQNCYVTVTYSRALINGDQANGILNSKYLGESEASSFHAFYIQQNLLNRPKGTLQGLILAWMGI